MLIAVGCTKGADQYSFKAHYIRTNGYNDGGEYPLVRIIRSVDELNKYYEENKESYYLGHKTDPNTKENIGFTDVCKRYDDQYFDDRILLIILLEEGSGSIRHKVNKVGFKNSKLIVDIERITPEIGTCDMAEWHILIEPEAGVDTVSESDVVVIIDGKSTSEK